MNRKYVVGLLALVVCVVTVSGAYAFGGLGSVQGNEAVKQALENGDYEAFVEAVASGITEEHFEQMQERYQQRTAVMQALEAGDYKAWVEAIESRPKITDKITEENFDKFVEMHEAGQAGDFETAKALAEELGLDQNHPQGGFRGGSRFGIKRGTGPCGQRQAWQGIGAGS